MTESRRELAASIGLLVLRLGAGGLLLGGHGWAKLASLGERAASFPDPIGLGPTISFWLVVFAEVPCVALVMAGFLTRIATVPIIGFLCVAVFIQHAHDPWPKREFPLLFTVAFTALLLTGAGRFSLDALRAARRAGGGRTPSA